MNVLKWCEVEAEYILKTEMRPKEVVTIYTFLLINKYDECDLDSMVVLQHTGDDRRGTESVLKDQDCACRNELYKASEERNCKDVFKNVN